MAQAISLTFFVVRRTGAFILLALALVVTGACSSSSTSTQNFAADNNNLRQSRSGEIYLFRGLANVFSLGIDEIGEKMVAKGLNAKVFNHSAWRGIADDIVERSKRRRVSYPIIIAGHSLGGNATIQMAQYLGDRGVKVSYAVSFDPTITNHVGPNVGEVINYYLPNSEHSNVVKQAPGFTGSLSNINVANVEGITHVTVEKAPKYQSRVINTTLRLAKVKQRGLPELPDVDQR